MLPLRITLSEPSLELLVAANQETINGVHTPSNQPRFFASEIVHTPELFNETFLHSRWEMEMERRNVLKSAGAAAAAIEVISAHAAASATLQPPTRSRNYPSLFNEGVVLAHFELSTGPIPAGETMDEAWRFRSRTAQRCQPTFGIIRRRRLPTHLARALRPTQPWSSLGNRGRLPLRHVCEKSCCIDPAGVRRFRGSRNADAHFGPDTSPTMKAWVAVPITKITFLVATRCYQTSTTTHFRTEMNAIETLGDY